MRLPSLTAIYLMKSGLPSSVVGNISFRHRLKILAREHSDDGARFNAVRLLDEAGQLEIADLETVLTRETDPDAQQALLELRE
jgi:hypothetical protein